MYILLHCFRSKERGYLGIGYYASHLSERRGMKHHIDRIKASRMSARILSVLLFFFWGAFFIEHLSWFFSESLTTIPANVWFVQGTHVFLLAGYLVSLKWEKTGSVLIVTNAVLFFTFAAGINAVPFIVVSLFPVMLYGYCWMRRANGAGVD